MKTKELSSYKLDYWTARALDLDGVTLASGDCCRIGGGTEMFRPSSDWVEAGWILREAKISLVWDETELVWMAGGEKDKHPLVAFCRAVVMEKFGDEVDD